MSAPSWIQGLKAISRKPPMPEDLVAVITEVQADKADRASALIVASMLQTALKRLVLVKLVELTETEMDGLFGRDAPMSTFSGLIRIAYAFGLVDEEIKRDLDRIREIRNAFAHASIPITFETKEVAHACEGLLAYKYRPIGMQVGSVKHTLARKQYQYSAGHLIEKFSRTSSMDLIVWPVSYRPAKHLPAASLQKLLQQQPPVPPQNPRRN